MSYRDGFFSFETLLKGLMSGIFFFYFQSSVVARDFDNYSKSSAKIEELVEFFELTRCKQNGAFLSVVAKDYNPDRDYNSDNLRKMYQDPERTWRKNTHSYNEWFVIYHWQLLMNDMHSKVPHLTQWQIEALDKVKSDFAAGKITYEQLREHYGSTTYRVANVIKFIHVTLRTMKDIEITNDMNKRRLLWADLINYSNQNVEGMMEDLFYLYKEKIISSDAVIMDNGARFSRLAEGTNYGGPLDWMRRAIEGIFWLVLACPSEGEE